MLSGGVDSEVILRCYHELKIPINVFVFKYENNYNLPDVAQALKICDELNITPTVIDFNLQRFFENDAYDIWTTGYYLNSGRLPHMKMIEYLDNIPIMGSGEPEWIFKDNKWFFELFEVGHSQSVYTATIKRPMVSDWYEYSPEIILAHCNVPAVSDLISSTSPGRLDIVKYQIHKDIWQNIELRPKRVGFEGTMKPGMNSSKPGFMLDFNKKYITPQISDSSYLFSKEELENLLLVTHLPK
jgi:hypothetical protein